MMKIIYYSLIAILAACLIGMFVASWINTDKAIDNRDQILWEVD